MDNGSNFEKVGQIIQNGTWYDMFWIPCVAHYMDLFSHEGF